MKKLERHLFQRCVSQSQTLLHPDEAQQHFEAKLGDLLVELAQMGDPRADAVIEELDALGPDASRMLQQGIKNGLETIQASPAIRAFLEEAEHLPGWVDPQRLQHGSEATLSIGMTWIILFLGPGSLTHTYSDPAIASVLVRTGNLTQMAKRRLQETGYWNMASILPGGLERGAEGYVHNLGVRLLHARVRTTLRKHGWQTGVPINQVQMARTWLDFTYVPFSALHRSGIKYTSEELRDLYHFWQYIGFLLGVDERLIRSITDQKRGQALLELLDATSEGPTEDSRLLVRSMIKAAEELLPLKIPSGLMFDLISALTRHLHGDELADQLGIKRTWVSMFMPLLTFANKCQRVWICRSTAARQRAVAKTVNRFKKLSLAGATDKTTYQRHLGNPTPGLP